ncbi:MAG: MerR family DNA-binding transcriptional regulator [Thermoleophilia bacterium]
MAHEQRETQINPTEQGYVRIGELSRRVGVSHDTLRAWERRYGLLKPERTAGGFRLYTPADEMRIAEMLQLLKRELAPARSRARSLAAVETTTPAPTVGDPSRRCATLKLRPGDGTQALDYLFAQYELDVLVTHFLLPYLRDLGERWADGVTVAQEHFASTVLRSRLLSLARDWDEGDGPRALLACPAGELHDIPLICLGLALHGRGWRVTLLGSDTPTVDTVVETAVALRPDACVVSAVFTEHFEAELDGLRTLAATTNVTIAGPGANQGIAEAVGCAVEPGDPVTVARRLTEARRTTAWVPSGSGPAGEQQDRGAGRGGQRGGDDAHRGPRPRQVAEGEAGDEHRHGEPDAREARDARDVRPDPGRQVAQAQPHRHQVPSVTPASLPPTSPSTTPSVTGLSAAARGASPSSGTPAQARANSRATNAEQGCITASSRSASGTACRRGRPCAATRTGPRPATARSRSSATRHAPAASAGSVKGRTGMSRPRATPAMVGLRPSGHERPAASRAYGTTSRTRQASITPTPAMQPATASRYSGSMPPE